MSDYLKEFNIKEPPKKITYLEGEPLELNEEFKFYHNKLKFRKYINQLQYLFQDYMEITLQAPGIRDSYLKKLYTNSYLMVIFTDQETIKETNRIIEKHADLLIEKGCYYLETTSDYMLLLSKDLEGIKAGTKTMRDILEQVLNDYFNVQNDFDKFIKIRLFSLYGCSPST
jgi:hypothetical protein